MSVVDRRPPNAGPGLMRFSITASVMLLSFCFLSGDAVVDPDTVLSASNNEICTMGFPARRDQHYYNEVDGQKSPSHRKTDGSGDPSYERVIDHSVIPCQAHQKAGCNYGLSGVHCDSTCDHQGREPRWCDWQPLPFETYGPGEYVGPSRQQHVHTYRLRVGDDLDLIYRLTRNETSEPYELNVGDRIRIESLTDDKLDRELEILHDGMITLRLLGQVRASRLTVEQLRQSIEEKYKKYYKVPAITVTPLEVNTRLNDLRDTVDSRQGIGGQALRVKVSPDGTVQLPALGSVPAQGLTMAELKAEIDERYAQDIQGIEVTPVLSSYAPRYVFVLGEVVQSGRYTLEGPTTVMGAISLAGGWNNGGNVRHVVVFRRDANWRLMATKLDLGGALYGKRPCPADEIWVRDSDIVLVPKSELLQATDFIELIFTRGIYGVLPFTGASLIELTTL
jgi:polysaccharide export outer membrane protein